MPYFNILNPPSVTAAADGTLSLVLCELEGHFIWNLKLVLLQSYPTETHKLQSKTIESGTVQVMKHSVERQHLLFVYLGKHGWHTHTPLCSFSFINFLFKFPFQDVGCHTEMVCGLFLPMCLLHGVPNFAERGKNRFNYDKKYIIWALFWLCIQNYLGFLVIFI